MAPYEVIPKKDDASENAALLQTLVILHADADETARASIAVALDSRVAALTQACDGQEALFHFARSAPDILIIDAALPRLDALALVRASRDMAAEIPIILTAVDGSALLLKQALDLGVNKYLDKPIAPDALRDALAACALLLWRQRNFTRERQLSALMLDGLPFPALLLDRKLKLVRGVNSAAKKFGLEVGMPCSGQFFPDEILAQEPQGDPWSYLDAQKPLLTSAVAVANRLWDITITPLSPRLMLLTALDITEAKRLEKLRNDAERIVRHDLKSPLNTILGAAQMLLIEAEGLTEQQLNYAEYIQSSGRRMLDLLNTVMSFVRMEEGSYKLLPRMLNLTAILKKIVEEFDTACRQKGLQLVVRIDGAPADWKIEHPVQGEAVLLESMFSNLLMNAIEASPEKATLSVDLYCDVGYRIDIHNLGAIPQVIRPRFFERYSSYGKEHGTGLGAYSARLIARTHGGDISFTTAESEGTHLLVTLPRVSQDAMFSAYASGVQTVTTPPVSQ